MTDHPAQFPSVLAPLDRRRGGFTLVEMLVVIGIIALLISILLPSLNAARETAKAIKCESNIRQLTTASFLYANDNAGYWPPGALYFITKNLDRWHGTRPTMNDPFTLPGAPIERYLPNKTIRDCPSFDFVSDANSFERNCGGYGYNNDFLGSSLGVPELAHLSLSMGPYEAQVVNVPAKLVQVRSSDQKIAFADAAIANPSLIEYSFVEPSLDVDGNATSPSIHFRHRGRASIAWADGHVTAERMDWTYPANVYGAANGAYHLGFFGPRDNTLFQRR